MNWRQTEVPRAAWLAYMAGRESQLRDEYMLKARRSEHFRKDNVHCARLFNHMYVYWLKKLTEERSKA
jgi:hypothetical protein